MTRPTREEVEKWRQTTHQFQDIQAILACYDSLCGVYLALLDECEEKDKEIERLKQDHARDRENVIRILTL